MKSFAGLLDEGPDLVVPFAVLSVGRTEACVTAVTHFGVRGLTLVIEAAAIEIDPNHFISPAGINGSCFSCE